MMAHQPNEAGVVLQQVCTTMSPNFQTQLLNSYRRLSAEGIDQLVDIEMQRLRLQYSGEEERYVQQMLHDNPVVVERRQCNTPRGSSSYSSSTEEGVATPDTAHQGSGGAAAKLLQQQRAESCRKSRINNKIKKAKTKFRHKFVSQKLTQSAHTLDCIRSVIAQAEAQLLCSGYQPATLQQLRRTFGVDRTSTEPHESAAANSSVSQSPTLSHMGESSGVAAAGTATHYANDRPMQFGSFANRLAHSD